MGTVLGDESFFAQLTDFRRSAFRLETKPAYSVAGERDLYARFRAGLPPTVGPDDRYILDWFEKIAHLTRGGATLTRVRIVDDPLTEYQRFLQWFDRFNRHTGEVIHYLGRAAARAVTLPAGPTDPDWWLFDDERLVVVTHDRKGHRVRAELDTDATALHQARRWRDLAITAAQAD